VWFLNLKISLCRVLRIPDVIIYAGTRLLYRKLEFEDDVLKYPEYLEEAYKAGKALAKAI